MKFSIKKKHQINHTNLLRTNILNKQKQKQKNKQTNKKTLFKKTNKDIDAVLMSISE